MKVQWEQRENKLVFNFELTDGDSPGPFRNPAGAQRLHSLANNSFYVALPEGTGIKDTHTDLIALGLVVLLDAFIEKKVELQEPVSRQFHETYLEATGKKVLPVSDKLKPRQASKGSVPALAYSGGTDSTAAVSLMPKETIMVFADRLQKEKQKYNKTAALQSCEELRKLGREVYQVETDLEYIIDPYTFPHILGTGVPAVFLADILNLDAIGFGNLFEIIHGLIDNKFNKPSRSRLTSLDQLFKVADLPVVHIAAGLSVYSTSEVLIKSGVDHIAQSCMYGSKLGEPCMACIKCLLKVTFQNMILGGETKDDTLDSLLSSPSVSREFSKHPTRMQNSYMFLAANIKTEHKMVGLLRKKLGGSIQNTDWMRRWYAPSLDLVPWKYKAEVKKNILQYIEPMSKKDEKTVRRWNVRIQKYSLARWYWHWKFWEYYGEKYGKYILVPSKESLYLEFGRKERVKTTLRVYVLKPFWLKKDITSKVSWGSSDSSVAYYKNRDVHVKKPGKAKLLARYGNSRTEVEVQVVQRS